MDVIVYLCIPASHVHAHPYPPRPHTRFSGTLQHVWLEFDEVLHVCHYSPTGSAVG